MLYSFMIDGYSGTTNASSPKEAAKNARFNYVLNRCQVLRYSPAFNTALKNAQSLPVKLDIVVASQTIPVTGSYR